MTEEKHNYTYIVRCKDGTYYTGWTNNLEKRMKAHNEGRGGAKYTRSRRPVVLVYYEESETPEEAMSREWHIKQMSRSRKEELIRIEKIKVEHQEVIDGKTIMEAGKYVVPGTGSYGNM